MRSWTSRRTRDAYSSPLILPSCNSRNGSVGTDGIEEKCIADPPSSYLYACSNTSRLAIAAASASKYSLFGKPETDPVVFPARLIGTHTIDPFRVAMPDRGEHRIGRAVAAIDRLARRERCTSRPCPDRKPHRSLPLRSVPDLDVHLEHLPILVRPEPHDLDVLTGLGRDVSPNRLKNVRPNIVPHLVGMGRHLGYGWHDAVAKMREVRGGEFKLSRRATPESSPSPPVAPRPVRQRPQESAPDPRDEQQKHAGYERVREPGRHAADRTDFVERVSPILPSSDRRVSPIPPRR